MHFTSHISEQMRSEIVVSVNYVCQISKNHEDPHIFDQNINNSFGWTVQAQLTNN